MIRIPLIFVLLGASSARAATWSYFLRAGTTQISAGAYAALPLVPSENVLMWGYAKCTDATFASCGAVTFPGPPLMASEGDTLSITIQNALTAPVAFPAMISEPTSLVVLGQLAAMTPVWVSVNATGSVTGVTSTGARAAGDTTSRVRSFTTETPVGGTTVYTWASLKPGSYLYESGTHPAVQVQMGLYGGLTVYPAATPASPTGPAPTSGQAYNDVSTAFDYEVSLLFSEVDPELHYAIASGRYGTPPPAPPAPTLRGQRTSTVNYAPRFFLVNGSPNPILPPVTAGKVGKKTLIRFLNAGLREKTPTLLGSYLNLVAEDGNPYTFVKVGVTSFAARHQYSLLLPAGKTSDAIWTPSAAGSVALFDRSLNLSNGSQPGGQLVYLTVVAAPTMPRPPGHRAVTVPSVGSIWTAGALRTITWPSFAPRVKIELVHDGKPVRTLARAARTNGHFLWSIPRTLPAALDYVIRISGGGKVIFSENFSIAPAVPAVFAVPFL